VLSPPECLTSDALVKALSEGWGLKVTSVAYLPVGWGSHHWEVTDADAGRWFATADDLDRKQPASEAAGAPLGRLRAALATALGLREGGATFVIAPIPTRAGEPLVLTDQGMGLALYPYVDGQSFSWGDFSTPAHRRGVLDLLIALHTAPAAARQHARTDDFAVPHRDELELALGGDAAGWQGGPYASRAAALLAGNEATIRRLLASYDDLVLQAGRWPGRAVLTHGEPHPGNTMLTSAGWVLIDWDTVLLAPPERDLCRLDPGDGSILRAYADATGTTLLPPLLELYRIRWDVADIAADVSRFRGPHSGSLDDDKCWELLCSLIGCLPG
jgi:Phosphotransferase enzyme family